jgi:hypothetical protein
MTETEKQTLGPLLQPADIAANIAKDAQKNSGALDVVSIGPLFAETGAGSQPAPRHDR